MTRYIPHLLPCGACGGDLLYQHCDACHRLFLHCAACELTLANPRDPAFPGERLPPGEHPACPRCKVTGVRPATRSDLHNRDLLDFARWEPPAVTDP